MHYQILGDLLLLLNLLGTLQGLRPYTQAIVSLVLNTGVQHRLLGLIAHHDTQLQVVTTSELMVDQARCHTYLYLRRLKYGCPRLKCGYLQSPYLIIIQAHIVEVVEVPTVVRNKGTIILLIIIEVAVLHRKVPHRHRTHAQSIKLLVELLNWGEVLTSLLRLHGNRNWVYSLFVIHRWGSRLCHLNRLGGILGALKELRIRNLGGLVAHQLIGNGLVSLLVLLLTTTKTHRLLLLLRLIIGVLSGFIG